MRKIVLSDAFKLARLIKEANLEDIFSKFTKLMKKDTSLTIHEDDSEEVKKEKQTLLEEKQQSMGFEIIKTVFEVCCTKELEERLYDLLGGIIEKDVTQQPLDELMADLKQVAAQNDILIFFKQAGRLMK